MAIFYGRNRSVSYSLVNSLGKGGEGEVFEVEGRNDLVAKIYWDSKFVSAPESPEPRQEMKEKIETMLDQPVNPYINGVLSVAWPQDILTNQQGQFVGYTMPRVNSKYHIFAASRERERLQLFPHYSWKTAVLIACNLTLAVKVVHQSGAVVGDMNPNNIMLDEKGHVTLIDTDSFNITNQKTGKIYKCTVGVSEMLPPELQGKDLSKPSSVFSVQTDSFALSIHIFNLLMNNCHPFGCTGLNQSQSSTSVNPLVSNILKGNCPYVNSRIGTASPDAPDIRMLPEDVRQLFQRAFGYTVSTAVRSDTISNRPQIEEWRNALLRLYESPMTECGKALPKLHLYPKSYSHCPWCDILHNRIPTTPPSPSPPPPPTPPTPTSPAPAPTPTLNHVQPRRRVVKFLVLSGIFVPILCFLYLVVSQIGISNFNTLSDVKNPFSWYYFNVYQASRLGLMSGYDDGRFAPDTEITREEAVVAAVRLTGITDPSAYSSENPFSDVSGWSAPWIAAASAKGIISGKGDGLFDPYGTISREEFVSMLVKATELGMGKKKVSFSDVTSDMWSYQSIMTAASNGIIKGKLILRFDSETVISFFQKLINGDSIHCFEPRADVTRAEASAMLVRAHRLLEKNTDSSRGNTSSASSAATADTANASGERVEDILALLSMMNYDGFEVSEEYTSGASAALHRWQKNHGLAESDDLSDELLLALRKALLRWMNDSGFQTAYPKPERALSADMVGDDVKYLQTALIIMDYADGQNHEHEMLHVTGVYDLATQQAVSRWQKARNLTQNGVADTALLGNLDSAMKNYLAKLVS